MNAKVTLDSWYVEAWQARKERGITQHEIAELTGIRQSRISQIETGQVDPKLSELIRISKALEMVLVMSPDQALPYVQLSIKEWERREKKGRGRTIPELILGDRLMPDG